LDEADTDLALEEEREEKARLRRAAEEAAGDDTGYVMTTPARLPTTTKGSVLSLAALEARAQVELEKRERKEREKKAAEQELALPILGRKEEIAGTIAAHRITIIEGESE
jgi:HrpA-like RNA helicase